jgi:hypothetical protein
MLPIAVVGLVDLKMLLIRVISQKDGIFLEIGVFSNTSTTSWQALNIDQASERNCDD